MKSDPKIEELRRGKEERKALFAAKGLRPLLIALNGCMAVYALSMLAAVFYYSRAGSYTNFLVMPGLLVVIMLFSHSLYTRRQFSGSAGMVAVSLCVQYRHLLWDPFWVLGSVARLMIIVFAIWIYLRMKDPLFSPGPNRRA